MSITRARNNTAVRQLIDLLATTEEGTQQAELNYESWRMTGEQRAARAAAERYQSAHARVPFHANRRRLERVQRALATAGDGDSNQ